MPSKQGLCWCFGGSRPPEISYGVELKPKPMEADIPMPTDENELNAKFEELVAELDLDKPHRDALCSLPSEKKWQIYCSKKKEQDDPSSTVWPDYYIERIKAMPSEFLGFSDEELETRSNLVEDLKTALRTQPMSFVVRFIDEGGVQCLLDYLSRMDYKSSESAIHTSVIGSIKALMNNSQGRAHVLAHPDSINIIAQSLSVENIKTKIAVLEILGACCIVPGGHKKTLDAMYHYQKYAGERTRFQSLIYDLDRSTGKYRDEVNLKTAVMSFINAALKYGPGMEHLEFRLHLRYEFLMLGIQPVIDKLRSHGNTTLDRHLDFFEMVRNEDERELAKRFDGTHVDTKSASSMFDLLKKKIALSVVYQNLQSILQHLLMLPYNNGNNLVGIWKLIDKMVQQVVLQQKIGGKDTDTAPLEINVKQLVLKLSNETDIKEYQQKLREVEKSKDDLSSKLAKRERECEAKTEEREELMSTISKMKSKLEKESSAHAEAKQQAAELIAKMEQFHMQLEAERGEREKLQHLVQTGSLPDDAKVGLSTPSMLNNPLSSITSVIPPPAPGPPPPPPPPGPPAPPGAPPPPGPPGMKPPGASTKKKNIPQPSHPLKSFNWSKLAEGKIKDTVWRDLDDCQIYNILDLQELEKTFSAYQRQQINDEDKQTFDKSVNKQKVKEFSVIDGRRAQNCIILLSKLKLTNEEISKAIMTMDEQEDLPKDMLEQMLKFIPTAEESQLLTENSHELENMARADRFLYEMSKIPHYENRLNSLYFKKKFQERLSDVKSRIEVVYDSSKQISRSRKLKKLLEIVLAFGNYMNKGQRGNAYGFRLSSLNKITDTKSSLNTNINLMNYLVEVVEKQFPDIMKIEEDLKSVKTASKVSFTELDKDIGALRSGLKLIDKELDYYRDRLPEAGDRFGAVMNNFHALASYNFSEVEEVYMEMKQKYQTVVKSFDEEEKVQPDEFFGIFESFLIAFSEAKADNEKIKKQKEEEKKRAELEEKLKKEKFLKKNTLEKQGNITNGTNTKGEFDDLISALRTGDVFGDDIAKMKRNRRRGQSPGLSRERTGARVN